MSPSRPILLDGSRGHLSTQRSKAILAKLKRGAEKTSIFDRHLALEQEIGGGPLVVGNKVKLLLDGPATYDSMFAAIAAAKNHINMETFLLEPDDIGQKFVNALLVKQRDGVQVNLIYDSVGSLTTPTEFFQQLINSGAKILEYNPINPLNIRGDWELNERDHRKLLVVDGKVAFVGGINISSVYSSGSFGRLFGKNSRSKKKHQELSTGWRDTHLRLEGPVVAEFQKLFMVTWTKQHGEKLNRHEYFPKLTNKGREVVHAIGSSPRESYSQIYVTLISAINSSESHVYITNAYFIPDQQLLDALKSASKRGVDVRLLLPGKSDSDFAFYAARSFYEELLSNGVNIYERRDGMLHAKTAVIDGVWSTVGSTNLDWRSFLNNLEINAVILSPDFGNRMKALFEQDLQSAVQITLEDWQNRPLLFHFKESGARLWAHML